MKQNDVIWLKCMRRMGRQKLTFSTTTQNNTESDGCQKVTDLEPGTQGGQTHTGFQTGNGNAIH